MATGRYEVKQKQPVWRSRIAKRCKALTWRERIILAVFGLFMLTGILMILLPQYTGMQQQRRIDSDIEAFYQAVSTAAPTAQTPEQTIFQEPALPDNDIQKRKCTALNEEMCFQNYLLAVYGQSKLLSGSYFDEQLLDPIAYGVPSEVVGVVSIPSISVEMPLYLGATYEHLASGFAQMSYSSFPVGGVNTNCVIAGHRGWRGAKYLLDADDIRLGDIVYLKNLWETLTYQVVEIKVISPSALHELVIQDGRDLLSIVTCTPVGVGSHRILITCERVDGT